MVDIAVARIALDIFLLPVPYSLFPVPFTAKYNALTDLSVAIHIVARGRRGKGKGNFTRFNFAPDRYQDFRKLVLTTSNSSQGKTT
jgi:hypothetical protein